jgi:hypothetical protein
MKQLKNSSKETDDIDNEEDIDDYGELAGKYTAYMHFGSRDSDVQSDVIACSEVELLSCNVGLLEDSDSFYNGLPMEDVKTGSI